MKTLISILLLLSFSTSFAYEEEALFQREIPLKLMPMCRSWIPEGRTWGCVNIERRYMADRNTVEALIQEIRDLKKRVKELEENL